MHLRTKVYSVTLRLFQSGWYIMTRGSAGSYDSSIFKFLRNSYCFPCWHYHFIFSPTESTTVVIFIPPHQCAFCYLFDGSCTNGCECLIVVLICFLRVLNDVEPLFIYLAICIALEKGLLKSWSFLNCCFCWILGVLNIVGINLFCYIVFRYFYLLRLVQYALLQRKHLNFHEVQFIFCHFLDLWWHSQKFVA